MTQDDVLTPFDEPTADPEVAQIPSWMKRGSAEDKVDYLLALENPRVAVQALAPDEFVHLVKGIGLTECSEIVAFASPRQLEAAIDLDAWEHVQISPARFGAWMELAQAAGPDTLNRLVAVQQDTFLGALVLPHLRIFEDAEHAEEGLAEDEELFNSPDGSVLLAVKADDPASGIIRRVLDALWATDVERGVNLLTVLRFELPSNLNDEALKNRDARLADLGYPSREEALALYEPVDLRALQNQLRALFDQIDVRQTAGLRPWVPPADEVSPGVARRLGLALHSRRRDTLLAEAIRRLPPFDATIARTGVLHVVNAVLVARFDLLAEPQIFEVAARHAADAIELGLARLAGEDPARASVVLRHIGARGAFRVGRTLVWQVAQLARTLARDLGGVRRVSLLDAPVRGVVEELLHPIGRRHGALARPKHPESADFQTLAELRRARAYVIECTRVATFLRDAFGLDLTLDDDVLLAAVAPVARKSVRLSTLFVTAIGQRLTTGRFGALPLEPAHAGRFVDLALGGPVRKVEGLRLRTLDPRVLVEIDVALDAHVKDETTRVALGRFTRRGLRRVEKAFAGLPKGALIDARVAEGVLLVEEKGGGVVN